MDRLRKFNNRWLIVPKLLYFCIAAAFYTFHQFRGQFITERIDGIDKQNLGNYISIPQTISFFTNLYFGALNDKSGKQRILLLCLFLASAGFFQTFFMVSDKLAFMANFTCYFCLISATLPLLDKVMVDYIENIPGMGVKTFGRQRVFATLGYLAANYIIEDMITVDPNDKKVKDFSKLAYYNWGSVAIACVLVALFVKNLPRRESSTNYFSSMKPLIFNFDYMYFIMIVLFCGISRAFMTNYLGLYCEKVLKFNDQENNLNLFWPLNLLVDAAYSHKQFTYTFFSVLLEVIVFFNSSYITDKLGLLWPIFLSQIFQLLRFMAYYSLSYKNENSFIFVCLIELLKGANYSLIHTSSLQLANAFSPPHLRTSSQFIYNGTFVALGTVLSGVFFQRFFSKGSGKKEDQGEVFDEFHRAFGANIIFSIIVLVCFIAKYAIFENLLFSRANTERKLKMIEEMANIEEEKNNELEKINHEEKVVVK